MKDKLGFAVIGCGMIANLYAKAIGDLPGGELVGAFDQDARRAEAFAQPLGIRAYTEMETLLADPAVDAVCVCTPSGLHAGQAIAAAEHGKHVVVEKPIGITAAQLDALEAAVAKNGVKLCAISQLAFSPAICAVKVALEAGALGKLYLADVSMKYYRASEYYQGSWHGTLAMDGGGALMNQGIHGVHLLTWLAGPVKTVSAACATLRHPIEAEDTVVAALEFANGALGSIIAATSVTPGQPRVLSLQGEKGTITLTEDRITTWEVAGTPCPEMETGEAGNMANDPSAIPSQNHTRQLADFVAAIRDNRAPLLDAAEGRRAVDLILAVYESAQTGRRVTVRA
ncbi:MAG: Gfo/Idh/MocA family oxidoreductase [Eubacteriales bacterium]|nr:Gfo/Idh/MocA family oxidoreductase [Eubacteriales bacterium]